MEDSVERLAAAGLALAADASDATPDTAPARLDDPELGIGLGLASTVLANLALALGRVPAPGPAVDAEAATAGDLELAVTPGAGGALARFVKGMSNRTLSAVKSGAVESASLPVRSCLLVAT